MYPELSRLPSPQSAAPPPASSESAMRRTMLPKTSSSTRFAPKPDGWVATAGGDAVAVLIWLLSVDSAPRAGRDRRGGWIRIGRDGDLGGAAVGGVEQLVEERTALDGHRIRVGVHDQYGLALAVRARPGVPPIAGEAATVAPGGAAGRWEPLDAVAVALVQIALGRGDRRHHRLEERRLEHAAREERSVEAGDVVHRGDDRPGRSGEGRAERRDIGQRRLPEQEIPVRVGAW